MTTPLAVRMSITPDYLRAFACGLILCDTVGCPATCDWDAFEAEGWQWDLCNLRRCPHCAANGVWGVGYAPRFPVPLPLPAPEPEPKALMAKARKRTGPASDVVRKAIAPPVETEQPA